jgi:hypothetical protein
MLGRRSQAYENVSAPLCYNLVAFCIQSHQTAEHRTILYSVVSALALRTD